MSLERTAAFVTTVTPDHTIHLPEDLPVGAMIAVVLLPFDTASADVEARRARFARARAALRRAAVWAEDQPAVDDATLDALIDRNRRA
jgi:hypothetical protein